MIGKEKLENAAREIEKTGKLEIVFTIEKEAIDKILIQSYKSFVETSGVESESLWQTAWQIIEKYLQMKKNGRL